MKPSAPSTSSTTMTPVSSNALRLSDAPLFFPNDLRVTEWVKQNQGEKDPETGNIRLKILRMFLRSEMGEPYSAWDQSGREVTCTARIRVTPYIDDLCERLACSAQFVRDCVNKIRKAPESIRGAALMKQPQGGGKGTPRGDAAPFLKAAILHVIVKLKRHIGSKRANSEIRSHMLAAATAQGATIKLPAAETISKWCQVDEIQHLLQTPYHEDHLRQVCGEPQEVISSNSVVQMDTTSFSERKTKNAQTPSLYVVGPDGRSIGPANVIFALHSAHRGVWTMLPFPGAANGYLAGLASKRGMMSKEPLLKAAGLAGSWPFHGLVGRVLHDNGSEFDCEHGTTSLRARGIAFNECSPPATPHFRGPIERFNRTAHGLFSQFLDSPQGKRYLVKVVDKPGAMGITLENLDRALIEWIVEGYHERPNAGLGGDSPIQRFHRLAVGSKNLPASGLPRPVPHTAELEWDFLWSHKATINQLGVVWRNRRYAPETGQGDLAAALRSFMRPGSRSSGAKMEFRYNPYNLCQIHIRYCPPGSSDPITLKIPFRLERSKYPDADESIRSCSLWQWEAWGQRVRSIDAGAMRGDESLTLLRQYLHNNHTQQAQKHRVRPSTERRHEAMAEHYGKDPVTTAVPVATKEAEQRRADRVSAPSKARISTKSKTRAPQPRLLPVRDGYDQY